MAGLAGKVAVVTGASRGIGAAIAKRLAREGAIVLVNYHQNAAAAGRVVEEIEARGGEAEAIQGDLADLEQIQRLFREVQEGFGRLDILVNNAGTAEFRALEEVDAEHYRRQFDLNVRGVLFATREAAGRMGQGGRIVNISSGAAQSTPPTTTVYAATKAAIEAMTKCLANELGPRGITVNVVAPGLTETDLLQTVIPKEAQEAMAARTPLGRLGTPEDIAEVVAFLASDAARWVTGQVIAASGGLR